MSLFTTFLRSASQKTNIALLKLNSKVFNNLPIRQDLIKRAIVYERSWLEQGTASQKNLGQVRGSTRKPFPQKGRGKARVGTMRAPMFRGGYAVHGDRPHLRTINIQRKVYNSAIRATLTAKFTQNQLIIVDSLSLEKPKKESLLEILKNLQITGKKVYFIYGNDEPEVNLITVSDRFKNRNYGGKDREVKREREILVSSARNISVLPMLDYEILVLDLKAVEVLEHMYKDKLIEEID